VLDALVRFLGKVPVLAVVPNFHMARLSSDRALQQWHHHEGLALVFAEFVNRADVRMIQRGSSAGFLFKTFQRFRVLAKLLGQEFQRNTATQLQVLCFVHHPHAPTTKDLQYSIMGNLTAEHVGTRRDLWPGSTLRMRHLPDRRDKSVAALGHRFDVFSAAVPLA